MEQAIKAYRTVVATDEYRNLERIRADARYIEASAHGNASRKAVRETDEEWYAVVDDKDAALAEKDSEIERLRAQLENIYN